MADETSVIEIKQERISCLLITKLINLLDRAVLENWGQIPGSQQ